MNQSKKIFKNLTSQFQYSGRTISWHSWIQIITILDSSELPTQYPPTLPKPWDRLRAFGGSCGAAASLVCQGTGVAVILHQLIWKISLFFVFLYIPGAGFVSSTVVLVVVIVMMNGKIAQAHHIHDHSDSSHHKRIE